MIIVAFVAVFHVGVKMVAIKPPRHPRPAEGASVQSFRYYPTVVSFELTARMLRVVVRLDRSRRTQNKSGDAGQVHATSLRSCSEVLRTPHRLRAHAGRHQCDRYRSGSYTKRSVNAQTSRHLAVLRYLHK